MNRKNLPERGGKRVVFSETGRDRANFRYKGTDVSKLSQDKGTTGQAQNFETEQDRIFRGCLSGSQSKRHNI